MTNEAMHPAKALMIRRMAERTDIKPLIGSMKSGEFQPEISDETLQRTFSLQRYEEAEVVWESTKPERMAASAIAIEEVWRGFERERYVLLTHGSLFFEEHQIKRMMQVTQHTFTANLNSWHTMREHRLRYGKQYWDHDDWIFHRLRSIIYFGQRNAILDEDTQTVADFISAGINTASYATWALIRSVPYIAKRDNIALTRSGAVSLIDAAFGPIITPLASMHKHVAVPIHRALINFQDIRLNEHFFHMKQTPTGPALEFDHDQLLSVLNRYGASALKSDPNGITTWCPAMYAMYGTRSVILDHHRFAIALAQKHYAGIFRLPETIRSDK